MSNINNIQEVPLLIPNFSEFCDLLYERLCIVLKHNKLFRGKFTLLANLIDRSNEENVRKERLKYIGINKQRSFLNDNLNDLDKYWKVLKKGQLITQENDVKAGKANQMAIISSQLFAEIVKGELDVKDINAGYLKDYFDYEKNKTQLSLKAVDNFLNTQEGPFKTTYQAAEYPILSTHFNIEEDRYLSIPLIRFGHFDGILHFIFTPKDISDTNTRRGIIEKQNSINQIITICSNIYEELILDWDLFGKNKFSDTYINLVELTTDIYYKEINKNPILRELGFPEYYKQSYKYLQSKLNQSIEVSFTIKNQYRRTAIISILIDSFAHNISAHSLTVLKWWFQQRAGLNYKNKWDIRNLNTLIETTLTEAVSLVSGLSHTSQNGDILKVKIQELEDKIQTAAQSVIQLRQKINNPEISTPEGIQIENAVIATKQSLANEIYPLLKFLLEKGAFWSGMIRRRQFGGTVENLFDILWQDFANNPLYLGTIVYSEGISKLNVYISIIDDTKENRNGKFYREKHYYTTANGTKLNGLFFSIDLSSTEELGHLDMDKLEEYPELESKSYFVKIGEKYKILRDYLKECKVFFPSGVVGKHSLFTIIENEIRNVKHYSLVDRLKMQKEGLSLNISIEEKHIRREHTKTSKQREIYKIGLWIKRSQLITKSILVNRLRKLGSDIMNEDFTPRLGGTYQDKICAAMLMNNRFISVQDLESDRAKQYYPWLKFSQILLHPNDKQDFQEEFEVSLRGYRGVTEIEELLYESNQVSEDFKSSFEEREGYISKIFHIWKGTELYEVKSKEDIDFAWENLLRFKFTNLTGAHKADYKAYFKNFREETPIRIISDSSVKDVNTAYAIWLGKWMKENIKDYRIILEIDGAKAAQIIYKNNQLIWTNKAHNRKLLNDKTITRIPSQTIVFAHAGTSKRENEGNYRSHGMLKQYFCEGEDIADAAIENPKLAELFEILMTNVCVFDNRIVKRLPKEKLLYYKNTLSCAFYEENLEDWEKAKSENIHQYHFLVMHLSFIEAMKNEKGETYGESNISEFIEKELLREYGKREVGDNFIFVITTGRGRTTWWTKLEEKKPEYTSFTTYRPVESLITAVENAVSKKDDIDLKMGLTQILFGS